MNRGTRAEREADLTAVQRALPLSGSEQKKYIGHVPWPKQRHFLGLTCLEALYGGAAGGGKTDALLMAAAQYIHVPGYSALILRRTFPELAKPNSIMDRAKQWWLPLGVDWSERDKRFTFPSGANITFGYLDTERDKYQYQSAEFQCIIFDELTEFPAEWYSFLFSRLRKTVGIQVPLRMRAGTNPGGIGHDWVHRRFVNDSTRLPGCEFVPAQLRDNPSVDPSYAESLAKLDPVVRRQLEEGIWVRDGGGLVYGQFQEARNCLPVLMGRETESWTYLLGLDFGIVDENAVTVLGWRAYDTCVYVVESYRLKALVHEMSAEVARLEAKYRFAQIVGDVGGMGKAFQGDIQSRHGIPIQAADKNNRVGYISLFNADLARGRIKVLSPTCPDLLQEWRELPWNDSRTKELEGFHNHASDSCLYAWRAATAYLEATAPLPGPPIGSPAYYAAEQERLQVAMHKQWEKRRGGGEDPYA